jgi:hypothetical protein
MRRLPHTQTLSRTISQAITPILARATREEHADVGARLMDTLHGREQRPFGAGPKLSRDEHFATRMFRHFSEVRKCLERLKDVETLISRYPFAGTRVTRAAYLQFVVEGQLHELYVLQERLLAWLVAIEKAYKSDHRAGDVAQTVKRIREAVQSAFRPLIQVRGSHVHELRYDNSDIGRLELIDLLSQSQDKEFVGAIRLLRKHATQVTHARLKQQVRNWNRVATSVLEAVHQALHILLFLPDQDAFNYPIPRRKE